MTYHQRSAKVVENKLFLNIDLGLCMCFVRTVLNTSKVAYCLIDVRITICLNILFYFPQGTTGHTFTKFMIRGSYFKNYHLGYLSHICTHFL